MDASERGNLLNRLADLLERDHAYLAVSALKSRGTCECVCATMSGNLDPADLHVGKKNGIQHSQ